MTGQQRLNAFYIGFYGTYAYKLDDRRWSRRDNEEILPRRELYLDLKQERSPEEDDALMKYDFRFLTKEEHRNLTNPSAESDKSHWFHVREVLKFEKVDGDSTVHEVVKPYLHKVGLPENGFAEATLSQLYDVIRSQELIHYFKETSQQIDHVLDIFIRTNSGGTKLEFSDLLTSITVAHWEGDFRKDLDELTQKIREEGVGFEIDRNWILKASLMLTDAEVEFKVQNFKKEQVEKIQKEWADVRECIKATFRFLHKLGIHQEALTSKYAILPICYYLYKKEGLYHSINEPNKHSKERKKIGRWLCMTLLRRVFSRRPDPTLKSIREVLKANIENALFPLENIIERYKNTTKYLHFEEDHVEELLDIRHGDNRGRPLLHLLFPEINSTTVEWHIDHLHPQSDFDQKKLEQHDFLKEDPELRAFYKEHWNLIANLHLLDKSQNLSKRAKPLAEWIKNPSVTLDAQKLLVDDGDLEFKDFKQFYEKRRANLKKRLEGLIFKSDRI